MAAQSIKILAIVGPTASGKTALSIALAKKFGGEIIAADSRTVYKLMDIGTAKPTLVEQCMVPHLGLDLVGPGQKLSVADYKEYAVKKIADIQSRSHLPILVGGSGLYVDAVLYNFSFAPPDEKLRQTLQNKTINQIQKQILSAHLKMPENHQNKRYLIRTLERGNTPLIKKPLNKDTLIVGLNPSKEVLKQRITKRALQMIEDGAIDEVKAVSKQYGWDCEAMTGGIYKVMRPYLEGKIGQTAAVSNLIASDLRLAKKQTTWFKRNKDIHWFDSADAAQAWLDAVIGVKLK